MRALKIDKELYGERHPSVANDLINMGAIQFERGNYKEAERYYRQSLDIIQPFYGKYHRKPHRIRQFYEFARNWRGSAPRLARRLPGNGVITTRLGPFARR